MRRGQFRVSLKSRAAAGAFFAFLLVLPAFLLAFSLTSGTAQGNASRQRTISLYNIHTKQTLRVTYKKNGKFVASAMAEINQLMRDWRRDEATKMDPELIDLLWSIHSELGSQKPIHLISGYRSRNTNDLLRRVQGGQARNSRHILGKAADVHFPDIPVKRLRNSALIREQGGVGYYPTSAIPFVHVDTGRVRHWPRLPRYELAALFPGGRSKHIPADGQPITKSDYMIAMARLTPRQKHEIQLARGDTRPASRPFGTILAGLGGKLPWRGAEPSRPAPAAEPRPASYQVASTDASIGVAYRHTSLSRPGVRLPDEANSPLQGWARAPAFDEEHPDELSYQPFPILPLMGEQSISMDKGLARLSHPDQTKIFLLLERPDMVIPLTFRPGLQFAEMLWASQFKGNAVPNLFSGTYYAKADDRRPLHRTARR